MIVLTRRLARRLRAVFRRSALGLDPLAPVAPLVLLGVGEGRVRVRHHQAGLAVACDLAVPATSAAGLALPLDALLDVEGDDHAAVRLEAAAPGRTVVRWQVGGVPQAREYAVPSLAELAPFPGPPAALTVVAPGLLAAMAGAAALTGGAAARGERGGAWLRGRDGAVVAVGGGQVLIRSGFAFPWDEDLALRLTPLWYGPGRIRGRPVALGRAAGIVTLEAGPWTVRFEVPAAAPPPPVGAARAVPMGPGPPPEDPGPTRPDAAS